MINKSIIPTNPGLGDTEIPLDAGFIARPSPYVHLPMVFTILYNNWLFPFLMCTFIRFPTNNTYSNYYT